MKRSEINLISNTGLQNLQAVLVNWHVLITMKTKSTRKFNLVAWTLAYIHLEHASEILLMASCKRDLTPVR